MASGAVLFDLDDTLIFTRPSYRELTRRFLEERGYRFPDRRWRALWRWSQAFWASSPELRALKERYADDLEGFQRAWNERKLRFLGVPQDDIPQLAQALQPLVQKWMERAEPWVPEEALRVLQGLKARGWRLGLITNRSQPLEPDFLQRLGLEPFFDTVLTAAEVGIWKPDPRIFHLALEHLDVPPQRAWFVGDNYFADIQGARRAGMAAVLFDPQDLYHELPIPRIRALSQLWSWLDGQA